jgi:hypothetical protein
MHGPAKEQTMDRKAQQREIGDLQEAPMDERGKRGINLDERMKRAEKNHPLRDIPAIEDLPPDAAPPRV